MSQLLSIHATHPQDRLIKQVAETIAAGGVLALPTDARYILAAAVDQFEAHQRMRNIKSLSDQHLFSLVCSAFQQVSEYAQMDDAEFRLLKQILPGAYTAILKGSKHLSRKLAHPKRKTVGIRMPAHTVLQAIVKKLNTPLLATSLELPHAPPLAEAIDIQKTLRNQIDMVVDCGESHLYETTVIDLSTTPYQLVRQGSAPIPW